ncbi:hypothetical protein pb186bvf_001632 [Paramecium bursaria]
MIKYLISISDNQTLFSSSTNFSWLGNRSKQLSDGFKQTHL